MYLNIGRVFSEVCEKNSETGLLTSEAQRCLKAPGSNPGKSSYIMNFVEGLGMP